MTTYFGDHLLEGDHASRPSASAVPEGSLYSCTDHNKIYQSDGTSTWTDWYVAGATAATFVGCKVYNDGTQSIPDNSSTAVTFGAEEYDTDGFHSTSSNTSRITIPSGKDGTYRFSYGTSLAANATGVRIAFLRKNGGGTDANNVIGSRQNMTPISGSLSCDAGRSVEVALVATDFIELFIYQNSGGALNAGSTLATDRGDVSWLSCEFLG